LGHFLDRGYPLGGIGRRDLKHLQAAPQANFVQQLLGVLYPFASSEISFQEMAAAGLSPAHEDGVGPGLEPLQNVDDVDAAGTQILNDAHRGRVLHPGRARHIRGGISAIGAHIGQDFRSKIHVTLLSHIQLLSRSIAFQWSAFSFLMKEVSFCLTSVIWLLKRS
jgi:hypothetical protein